LTPYEATGDGVAKIVNLIPVCTGQHGRVQRAFLLMSVRLKFHKACLYQLYYQGRMQP
jgi:hypothetical protein